MRSRVLSKAIVLAAAVLTAATFQPGTGSAMAPRPGDRPQPGSTAEQLAGTTGSRTITVSPGQPSAPPAQLKAAETRRLTVQVIGRAGQVPTDEEASRFTVYDLATGVPVSGRLVGGTGQVELPAGSYRVATWIYTPEPGRPEARAMMVRSLVDLTKDATIVLDARTTREIKVGLDVPGAELVLGDGIVPLTTKGQRHAFALPIEDGLFVSPAAGLPLRVTSIWIKGADRYSLWNTSEDQIPAVPEFRNRPKDLAKVTTSYPGQGSKSCVGITEGPLMTDTGFQIGYGAAPRTMPGTHTSYYTTGKTTWSVDHSVGEATCKFFGFELSLSQDRFPHPGTYKRTWHTAPLIPSLSAYNAIDQIPSVVRRENVLDVSMSLFSDGVAGHAGGMSAPWESGQITGKTVLYKDREILGSSPYAGWGSFTLPQESARYRMETSAVRTVPWSDLGTRTDATWAFSSQAGTGTPPIMAVKYDADLDQFSQAPAGKPFQFTARILNQPGVQGNRIEKFNVEVSYDDGVTWLPTKLRPGRGHWTVSVTHPAGAGYVSLRTVAADGSGNSVQQTSIRAYKLS